VSEGGSGRSHRDTRANGESFDVVFSTGIFTAATSLFTSDVPPADLKSLVPKIHGAAFFIYGEKGQPVEEPANKGFYEVAHEPKEIWEVPGSGHMGGPKAQPEQYERRVVAFFDRHLSP
jgi:pimeloyl-ACP methyl ester carboxylesterase